MVHHFYRPQQLLLLCRKSRYAPLVPADRLVSLRATDLIDDGFKLTCVPPHEDRLRRACTSYLKVGAVTSTQPFSRLLRSHLFLKTSKAMGSDKARLKAFAAKQKSLLLFTKPSVSFYLQSVATPPVRLLRLAVLRPCGLAVSGSLKHCCPVF